MPLNYNDGEYVGKTLAMWEKHPDDVNFQIQKFQYAISRDLKKEKDNEYFEALEQLRENIANKTFWLQMDIFMSIELPKD